MSNTVDGGQSTIIAKPIIEAEGADRIFRRSVATHKMRYTDLYSDGDSKSYNQVKTVMLLMEFEEDRPAT